MMSLVSQTKGHIHEGPFTNTCKGGPDAKNIYHEIFFGPPSDRKNISGPPFLP